MKAATWMIGAIVSFTSMAVAGREVSFELDTFEIMMFRSFIGIAVVMLVAGFAGTLREITRRHMSVQFIRNLCHFTGQNLWFYAITVIPLAQVFAMEFTMPIWAMFLAVFILNEPLTKPRVATAILGFGGILIVARPWGAEIGYGIVFAAIAAMFFAATAVLTRRLTRTESITCILFWLTVLQGIFGVVFAGYDGDISLPSAQTWPWIILIGLAGLVAHFCMTKALSFAPAAIVSPIDFTRLPLIAVVGMLLYNEPIQFSVVIGGLIIFAANYLNIMAETRSIRA